MKTFGLSVILIFTCMTALADEQDEFYLGDANCRIVNPTPLHDEKATWSGSCKDGYADGRGVLQWYLQEKPGSRYEGTMEKGRPQGSGVYSYTSNARYEGEYKNGKRHGKGVLTSPDGTTLTATFVDGDAVGNVERSTPSGYQYKGGWKNGKPEGKGQAKYTTGVLYEGDFKDGSRDGIGIMTYPTGIRYEGSWKQDKYNGKGRVKLADGEKYEGDFKDGWRDGIGTVTFPAGNGYEGSWKQGKYDGKGTLVYPDGTRLEGDFKDGVRLNQKKGLPSVNYAASKFLKSSAATVAYAEQYDSAKDHKAFAISALHAWGWVADQPTAAAAINEALVKCNARVTKGEPPCFIFEVDGNVVKTAAAEEKAMVDKFSNGYIDAILKAADPFDQTHFDEAVSRLGRFVHPLNMASKRAADDYTRGVAELNKGNHDVAISFLKNAAVASPGLYEIHYALALALINAERYQEADTALRLALQLNLRNREVWAAEALVLNKIDSAERARLPLLAAYELISDQEKGQTLDTFKATSENEPDTTLRSVYQSVIPLLEARAASVHATSKVSAAAKKNLTGQTTDANISKSALLLFSSCKQPEYPKAALSRGAHGTVVVGFQVGEFGNVLDAVILQSSGEQDLDIEVRDAVSLCKFSFPASAGVKEVWTKMQYIWKLN